MVDVRLREVQTAPEEDVWLYATTPRFTAPLSVFMHAASAGEGGGENDVYLYDSDEWIPVDAPDLALWLRGDMYSFASVYSLEDQSGGGHDAEGSSGLVQPAFNVFGKESMVLPTGEYLSIASALATDGGPCTLVVVYRSARDATASQIVGWYGSGSTANTANVGSSYLMDTSFSLGATASVSSATVGHSYGQDSISHREVIVRDGLVASTDSTGYACKVDGNTRQLMASTADPMTFTAGIGSFDGSAVDAGIAEVIVYNRALDGADLASLHAYLDERYVWTPLDIAATCVLWLRGDYGQSATGWLDQSGNGNHATQLAGAPYEPSVGTTLINGQATARFTTDANYDLPGLYLSAGSFTAFVVYKLDAPLGAGLFGVLAYWEDSNGATSNVAFLANHGSYTPLTACAGYSATSASVGFGTADLYDDNAHTISLTYDAGGADPTDPANYTCFDNWISLTPSTTANSAVVTGKIGGDGLGNGIVGEIAEVIIYDGILSARDQLSVTEYLSQRYDTLSATGSGSGTIAPLVASGSGTASAGVSITGTGSGTLQPLVADGVGGETFTGTGSGTLSSLVASGAGSETFTGTGSGTLSPLVADGVATEVFTGTGSGTLQPLVSSGAGTETMTGTGSGTLSPLVASGSGAETMTGTGSGTLSPLVASGSGSETFTGTGSGALAPLVASGSAAETMTGTGSGTLQPLVADGIATESFTGSGSGTIAPLAASGAGAETFTGTGSAALPPLVASGSGTETITGSGSGTLQPLAADGSGSAGGAGVTGTGSAALSPLVGDGSAVESMTGTGGGIIAPLAASGAGVESFVGTGSAALGPLVASGTGTAWVNVSGSGGAVLSSLDSSGAGVLVISGTGSASISSLVALGFYIAPLAGAPRATLTRSEAHAAISEAHAASTLSDVRAATALSDALAASTLATSTAKARLA